MVEKIKVMRKNINKYVKIKSFILLNIIDLIINSFYFYILQY